MKPTIRAIIIPMIVPHTDFLFFAISIIYKVYANYY